MPFSGGLCLPGKVVGLGKPILPMLATFAAFGSCGILFQGLDCLEEEVAEQTTCWILQDADEAGDTL